MTNSHNKKNKITASIVLLLISISFLFYSYATGITGKTLKNGIGCDCHSITPSLNVNVSIVGPSQVEANTTVTYQLKITGGPAVRGGTNIAALSGSLTALPPLQKMEDELTHQLPQAFINDTLTFTFNYTAPAEVGFDTIYANGNSVNFNGQNTGDQWNFAPNKPIEIVNVVPVELTNFSADKIKNNIVLIWSTATEINNHGFEIQRTNRKNNIDEWLTIGFVKGNGNSTQTKNYLFEDKDLFPGKYQYRLKQVDLNGTFAFHNLENEIEINIPENFSLKQNFPNPFNPSTVISWQLPVGSQVSLKVYDILGREIVTLINEEKPAGIYEVKFDASNLSSGIYYYQLTAGEFKSVKKMIIAK